MDSLMRPEIICELLCRFIVNLPNTELREDRIFFHIQEAHWYYLDFVLSRKDIYPRPIYLNIKKFGQVLLEKSPIQIFDSGKYNEYYSSFHSYQSQIPVCGAIILNQNLDKVLLVMNYKCTSYSFPKGKINQKERELDCAAREVWEEIGFSITNSISESDFIELLLYEHQKNKMYILTGVDEKTEFRTKTRFEIGKIEWVKLKDIEENTSTRKIYKNILPFLGPLKKWIEAHNIRKNETSSNLNNDKKKQNKFQIIQRDKKIEENQNTNNIKLLEFEKRLNDVWSSYSSETVLKNPLLEFKLNWENFKNIFD